jgi:hypothetical protein
MGIPFVLLRCYDTPTSSFNEKILIVQSNAHMMDVLYWMLFQKFKRICEK